MLRWRNIRSLILGIKILAGSLIITGGVAFWFCLPLDLFQDPYSTVLEDKYGGLLGARIADDGQWRFPENDDVSEKFEKSVLLFEDEHFYLHPGVNPFSLIRAACHNIKEGEIVSGGSTITMQVIRMSRKGKARTLQQKLIEILMALRLEMRMSKKEILGLYVSHAPFGGNVVGLDAASWRYFNRPSQDLSWAEAATLAVLPNAPALIHPGRNSDVLITKRNKLLKKLFENGNIDSLSCYLAMLEVLPKKPVPLPQKARHLLSRVFRDKKGEIVKTTIDPYLQDQIEEIVLNHYKLWSDNHVYNAAILVAEVETGDVVAYIGNIPKYGQREHGNEVDIIPSPRSSGSILKPILFAAKNDAGEILPSTLVPDIPLQMGGFTPKNFSLSYEGMVPAQQALSRSLNIPSVFMLKEFGLQRFHHLLRDIGMSTINYTADHYGLSLILGGAEVSLWDLVGVYASFSRTLNHFYDYSGRYDPGDFRSLNFIFNKRNHTSKNFGDLEKKSLISASAIWQTYEALSRVNRPAALKSWQNFSSMGKVAWKTGTSFGFRDAWAVGTTPAYVVGVWMGNADGEGRPGLTGLNAAAPALFDVFSLLPDSGWFDIPYDEMTRIAVCKQSGHRPGMYCTDTVFQWVCNPGLKTEPCPYHILIHVDQSKEFRVNIDCEDQSNVIASSWFVLPAVPEWYYAKKHACYKSLPPVRRDCYSGDEPAMGFIFPAPSSKIFVPTDLGGKKGKTVFKLAHRIPETVVYWHLDDTYIGHTSGRHQMGLNPLPGNHVITAVDESGNSISRVFEIVKD